jgi:hypothetical protein
LANSNNVVLKAITVDATAGGTYAVQFTGACNNVLIRDCKLLARLTGTTAATGYAPIYKANNTGVADNISIINNLLDGGYYGFYFYAGTSLYGSNNVFDSNTVSNQYYYGVNAQFVSFTSCSYNTILSRTTNAYASWEGLSLSYANGNVISNRIIQRSTAITRPYGITISGYYNYTALNMGLIANNEIILNTTGSYSGIRTGIATNAKILHNSIYISGSGAAMGIYIANDANNVIEIKNNNIMMEPTGAYPIYLNSIANLALYDIDYNNMYAPTNIGYAGSAKGSIAAWQQTITTDLHSVSIRPGFIDSTVNLELLDYTGVRCNMLFDVDRDIENAFRVGPFTYMGCYHEITS